MSFTKKISEPSLSICHEYHSYINQYVTNRNSKTYFREIRYDLDNSSNYCEFLNQWLEELYINYVIDDPNAFVNQMIKSIKHDIEDFSWLDNPRVCYFTWISLKKEVRYDRREITPNLPILNENCSSTESRAKVIKQYFQAWDTYQNNKIDVISVIKRNWQFVDKMKHPFQKLMADINNQALIEWTWNYIIGRLDNDFGFRSNQVQRLFVPTTLNEKYQAIFAIHDYHYTADKNLHKVFCSEYKRALSQKKFREKENTKTINFQIGTEYKEKLDELLYHYQYSQQKFFEMLISDHYKLVQDKSSTRDFS